jgi:hypothetical protein
MLRAAGSSVASGRSPRARPVPVGLVMPMEGCRDAVSGWRAGVGQGTRLARSGLVRIGFAGGLFEMRRFADGGSAGRGDCHTLVTSGAKHSGTQRDPLRRFVLVGEGGGTGWDG